MALDCGRIVEVLAEDLKGLDCENGRYWPKSASVGLRGPWREGVYVRPFTREDDESEYKVDESVVDIELLGEFGRPFSSVAVLRCDFWRPAAYMLNSVPSEVRVGFVMGAEMTVSRMPCETESTVTGERRAGLNLSYGTELSFRSWPEIEDCRGLLFFLPKKLSFI